MGRRCLKAGTRGSLRAIREPLGKELSDSGTGLKGFSSSTPFPGRALQEKTSSLPRGGEDRPFCSLKPPIQVATIKNLPASCGVVLQSLLARASPAEIFLGLVFPDEPLRGCQDSRQPPASRSATSAALFGGCGEKDFLLGEGAPSFSGAEDTARDWCSLPAAPRPQPCRHVRKTTRALFQRPRR